MNKEEIEIFAQMVDWAFEYLAEYSNSSGDWEKLKKAQIMVKELQENIK